MQHRLSPAETGLLSAFIVSIAVACFGPSVAQFDHYHAFADQRTLWGLPYAMDVLSNIPFAVMGAWGLQRLRAFSLQPAQRLLAALFFAGLLLTALCSSYYHLQPDNAGLAIDRMGMLATFAGLMGLAVADRITIRAGLCTAAVVVALGPVAVYSWATTGNLLPWSVVQGGGMLLIVVLALRKPVTGAWGMPLAAVIAWYALAKLLELGDQQVLDLTQGLVSGHTLKHLTAAMAAWPVIAVMQNGAQTHSGPQTKAGNRVMRSN